MLGLQQYCESRNVLKCCQNAPCASSSHRVVITDMYDYSVHSLVTASHEALKCVKITDSRVIWSPTLSSLKTDSRRVLQNWRNNGCPTSGVLLDNKQSTKRFYKNALKELKRSCITMLVDAYA